MHNGRAAIVAGSLALLTILAFVVVFRHTTSEPLGPPSRQQAPEVPAARQATSQAPPMDRHLVPGAWRLQVVDENDSPVPQALVSWARSHERAVRADSALGYTDADGQLFITAPTDSEAKDGRTLIASTPDLGSGIFEKANSNVWRCVLRKRETVIIAFRLESGAPVHESCIVAVSQRPWAARQGRTWLDGANAWNDNPMLPAAAVHVARSHEGMARLVGLRKGDYWAEVMCHDYVAVGGISEKELMKVPGGPYECILRPVVAAVVGVRQPDELVAKSYKLPPGVDAYPLYGYRAVRRLEAALRLQYPAGQWVVVVGVDERPRGNNGALSMTIHGFSTRRRWWQHEARLLPLAEVRPEVPAIDLDTDCTADVQLVMNDFEGRPVEDGRVTLIGGKLDYGKDLSLQLRVGYPSRVPKGRYRLQSPCRTLEDAMKGVEIDVRNDGPVTVGVPRPLLPCRIRLQPAAADFASVKVTIDTETGPLWAYGCDGDDQPLAWLPEGRVEVGVVTPGYEPVKAWFDVTVASSGRPIDLPVSMRTLR